MPDFSRRTLDPELMDTEACGPDEFRACLVDLAKVNRLTLAYRPTLGFLARATRDRPGPLRVVDIGGGYGDMLRVIDRWAARRRLDLRLTSVDLNPFARSAGEAASRQARTHGRPIEWVTADLFDYRPEHPPDLVISSLFAHHLDDAGVVRFVAWMERTARRGWFVNDLHRHPLPYHVFAAASRLMRWHRFVQHDGPVSIARAFIRADWQRLLRDAGLPPGAASLTWRLPFRLCVTRLR